MNTIVRWFIESRVAANLLMLFVALGGALALSGMRQEIFPRITVQRVSVTVAWPGATPEEAEEGICLKVEEVIDGLEGIRRVTSAASAGVGAVIAECAMTADERIVLDDVKTRVHAISTFPREAEKPVVTLVEAPNMVLSVVVSGETDALTLERLGRQVRDEIAGLPEVSRVEIANANDYEVSIEVSEDALRRYGVSFDDVVAAVRQGSINLGTGTIETRGGEILLRTDTQAYVGEEFEDLLLLRGADGTRIRLGDVAQVVDGLAEEDQWSTFDGRPALTVTVFRTGEQSAPDVARAVSTYLEAKRAELPPGVELTVWKDWSDLLRQRLDLLLGSGKWGLVLIFGVLALFLQVRLALWVALGIPIALLGAVWLLPLADVSINMVSLFGFILVLGILVDDGIVVGENIVHHLRSGSGGAEAARRGVREVMRPVILAVVTTVAAFIPMLTIPGMIGQFTRPIPVVVVCALAFSLVESLLILPRHLSHARRPGRGEPRRLPARIAGWAPELVSRVLDRLVDRLYRPALDAALRWRYLTLASDLALLILVAGLLGARHIRFSFFPPIAGDQVVATVTMPEGTPVEATRQAVERIQRGVETVRASLEGELAVPVVRHVLVSVGTQPQAAEANWAHGGGAPRGAHLGEVFIELFPPETRGRLPAETVLRELRRAVGPVPGAEEVSYAVSISGMGPPIHVELRSEELDHLRAAARRLEERLAGFEGTFDVSSDLRTGQRELRLLVRPEAEALGITQAELARQVRQGFYGDEAQRIQRGPDDVRVMVRYPRAERRSLADVENMRLRVAGGGEVPFSTVATLVEGRTPATIRRARGCRKASVTADVDLAVANTNEIVADLKATVLPDLLREFPSVRYSFEGEQREQAETMGGLTAGFVFAALLIYTLLALAFGSFLQPVIVLVAVPFGALGAILGHWALGQDLTFLSFIGLLAMAGVVVNDSMILVDFVNRARAQGTSALAAVLAAGPRRFRAIFLTSLTTFAGLTPLLAETSVQAQFLIPMAISLAFGVLFSTLVTLVLVPALYLVLEDGVRFVGRGGEGAEPGPSPC